MTPLRSMNDETGARGSGRMVSLAAAACIILIVWMGLGWDRVKSRET